LWYHTDGCWVHQDFLELEEEEVEYWFSLHGVVRKAVVGNGDMYMTMEELEGGQHIVWIVYKELDNGMLENIEYQVVVMLQTPAWPNRSDE
jgi:hypothetical protein